ncbi:hypothetical protein DFS34DRAFT_102244 [Phlyctochytrium arcticum]|nr:hypothetical protein DFS34DRAFT_102244 [Phlyctochytrium arcticum]
MSLCCLSPHMGDKLRLINVPAPLVEPFAALLQRSWQKGIQNRTLYGRSLEFKLRGYPWYGQGNDAVPSRELVCAIMEFMYHNGWKLMCCADISKKQGDKDSWFFEPLLATPASISTAFASISFNRSDRIRLIRFPPPVQSALISGIRTAHPSIQSEKVISGTNAYEFKILGNPWYASGTECVESRILVMKILACLKQLGWEVYTTVDVSGVSGDNVGDLDSWILKSN